MIGTTLVREPPAPIRQGTSRTASLPVLIEVPTLPGSRPRRPRPSPRSRVTSDRPRRRLRREVRVAVVALFVGTLAGSSVFVLREGTSVGFGHDRSTELPAVVADPFPIELEQPIPEPVDANSAEPDPWGEGTPVAFPGYLLPGDGDGIADAEGNQEHGHERP